MTTEAKSREEFAYSVFASHEEFNAVVSGEKKFVLTNNPELGVGDVLTIIEDGYDERILSGKVTYAESPLEGVSICQVEWWFDAMSQGADT